MQGLKDSIATYTERYWGVIVLFLWGGGLLVFGLIRTEPYGIDEGAARGLILNWAIGDRVLNPLITLGVPDFRAVLFFPLGLYWAGSIIAAKVFTMLLAFLAVTMLYRWSRTYADNETALVACGLLLIFPLFINQVDALAPGVFLLLAFAVGAWIDTRYDRKQFLLGGWFFTHLFWVVITVTIHPIGLAYPLALAWHWHNKEGLDTRRKRHLYIGLTVVVGTTLAMRAGWQTIDWYTNPLVSLGESYHAITGLTGEPNLLLGASIGLMLVVLAWIDRRFLLSNLLGAMLLTGVVIGLTAADDTWAMIAITLILLRGTYYLIRMNESLGKNAPGLLRNRGIVLAVLFAVSLTAMVADRSRAQAINEGILSMEDELIRTLAVEAEEADREASEDFHIASQWPGRTMIASKLNTFPLPPTTGETREEFLESIRGITHIIFNPGEPDNRALSLRLAELTEVAKTVEMNDAGVIISIKHPDSGIPPEEATAGSR